ncbi:MAG: SagB/ThcOx family dehydrogenase [Terrimicrobiaceae bacterium]
MRILCAALVVLAATSSAPCAEENASPFEQLRTFLKSPPGDIRQAGDMAKGIPAPPATKEIPENARRIALPKPSTDSQSLTSVLASRRSARSFSTDPLPLEKLAFLLWASQGITGKNESGTLRAAPSAGGLYPLETYVCAQRVAGLEPGVYRYDPAGNSLVAVSENPALPEKLAIACHRQPVVTGAAAVLVWTATPARTEWKYAHGAHRMIAMEAGHACQNALLAATSLGVAACPLLSYHQGALDQILGVDGHDEFAIYLAAVGKPAKN